MAPRTGEGSQNLPCIRKGGCLLQRPSLRGVFVPSGDIGPYDQKNESREDGQEKDHKAGEPEVFPAAKHQGAEGDKGGEDHELGYEFHTTSKAFTYLIDAATTRMLPTAVSYMIHLGEAVS